MKRREFVSGIAAALLVHADRGWAQQPAGEVRRLAVLHAGDENDADNRLYVEAFRTTLTELGWLEGRNIRTEYRWARGDRQTMRSYAKELAAARPDVFFAVTTPATHSIREQTSTSPIVFVNVSDPIGDGFAQSLSRPGMNLTGFVNFEGSVATKWLQLIKEVAPATMQAAILINPETAPGGGSYFSRPFEQAALALAIKPSVAHVRSQAEIEAVMKAQASQGSGALVLPPGGAFTRTHRDFIIARALHHRLPAIYQDRALAQAGGLLSYGPNYPGLFRQAASYVDRVLKGASAGMLPIQLPSKFELVVNLRTARSQGLTIAPLFLAQADEVIE
jgi:putative ABC transport system substrate-binding protein